MQILQRGLLLYILYILWEILITDTYRLLNMLINLKFIKFEPLLMCNF